MKRRFILLLLSFPPLFDVAVTAQRRAVTHAPSTQSYDISGTVINRLDGSPVPHCYLTWEPIERSGRNHGSRSFSSISGVESDDLGRFTLTVPSAGWWRLRAAAKGYVTQLYEQHDLFYAAVVVGPETPHPDIQFMIDPEGAITGTVLDEAGEPVRNARITLEEISPPIPGLDPSPIVQKQIVRTDDRGFYELANLSPGGYRIKLQAKPWYATENKGTQNSPQHEPSLDVVYPNQWYPGATDSHLAETIDLGPGEKRIADFRLNPVPAGHIRVANISVQTAPFIHAFGSSTYEDAGQSRPAGPGQTDIGGLTPGVYQVSENNQSRLVQVTSNGTQSVDMTTTASNITHLSINFSSDVDDEDGPWHTSVQLISTDGQATTYSVPTNRSHSGRDSESIQSIEIPPGRYEVSMTARPGIYLSGISAKGAEIDGKFVTADAGDAILSVRTATTHATLNGIAKQNKKVIQGAMVLLIPITVEDQANLIPAKEEISNSDGSFELLDIIPGKYILLVVREGWRINWHDPSTLRSYLSQGIALEVTPDSKIRQEVRAIDP